MQRIISASRQFIQEVDTAALSDQEESCASHGFEKMAKLSISNMPKQFMDDSEVCTPASSCRVGSKIDSPCKVRKALKVALKKQCSHEQTDNENELINQKMSGFEITLDQVSSEGETNDCSSSGGRQAFNDAASMISHSAFSSISKSEESINASSSDEEVQSNGERLLTKAERDSFFAPKPVMKTTFTEFKPTVKAFQPTAMPAFWMPSMNQSVVEPECLSADNV